MVNICYNIFSPYRFISLTLIPGMFAKIMGYSIVTALREIGNGKLKDSDRNLVREQLKKVSENNFYHDVTLAPAWVQKELRELNEIYRHTA